MVEIRRLPAESLTLLFQIDRSERVEVHHIVEDGELRSEAVDWHVPNWNPEGDGPYSVGGLLADLRPILGRGGVLLGVFVDDRVAGIAVVETGFEPSLTWLAFLHVSRPVAAPAWHPDSGMRRCAWRERQETSRSTSRPPRQSRRSAST